MTPPGSVASSPSADSTGIVLVLGAGGARGPAHAGVLRRLRDEKVPIDAVLGASVGAIVGALWAGAGVDPDEMIAAARGLGPAALFAFALSRWRLPLLSRRALARSGAIPDYLRRLEGTSFATLHHGVRRLGILTFDLLAREEVFLYGGPGLVPALPLPAAVKASAAIPGLFPPLIARFGRRRRFLADAGWFTAVPVERAFAPPVASRRVIAVDLSLWSCPRQARRRYWRALEEDCGERLVLLRPRLGGTGTMVPKRGDVERLVGAGEEALQGEALARVRAWIAPEAARGAGFP